MMWDTLTRAELEAAKQAWQKRRDEMVARHQVEIESLKRDLHLLQTLEGAIMEFKKRFAGSVAIPENTLKITHNLQLTTKPEPQEDPGPQDPGLPYGPNFPPRE